MNMYLNLIEKVDFLLKNKLLDNISFFILKSPHQKTHNIYFHWRLSHCNEIVFGGAGNIGRKYKFKQPLLDCDNSYDYQLKLESLFNTSLIEPDDVNMTPFYSGVTFHQSDYFTRLSQIFGENHIRSFNSYTLYKKLDNQIPNEFMENKKTKI